MKLKSAFAAACLAALTMSGANAQLLSWDVSGSNTNGALPATGVAADLSTSSGLNQLSRVGVVYSSAANSYNSNTWNLTDTFNTNNSYITFSLTPVTGYEMTLTTLQYAINGSNTAPGTGRWGYSIDGGAFVLQDPFNLLNPAPSGLSTWDFVDFTTAGTVEFRFWAYGAASITNGTSMTGGTIRISNISGNDLVLNGSVTLIPEPTSLAFLGLSGLAFAGYLVRRRKR